jgi:hypothetical protein
MWGLRSHTRCIRQALSDPAQHAIRQGTQAGRNIAAAVRLHPTSIHPFRYKMLGQLAAIGRHRGVASILGLRFSGLPAWFLWRSAYLMKLPSVMKKLCVMLEWTLDLCFARDTVQLLTAHTVRSGRLDELMDDARAGDSPDTVDLSRPDITRNRAVKSSNSGSSWSLREGGFRTPNCPAATESFFHLRNW